MPSNELFFSRNGEAHTYTLSGLSVWECIVLDEDEKGEHLVLSEKSTIPSRLNDRVRAGDVLVAINDKDSLSEDVDIISSIADTFRLAQQSASLHFLDTQQCTLSRFLFLQRLKRDKEVDILGYPLSPTEYVSMLAERARESERDAALLDDWHAFLTKDPFSQQAHTQPSALHSTHKERAKERAERSPALVRLVRRGVPHSLRPRVWAELSQSERERESFPADYYTQLLRTEISATVRDDIEKDLDRTFPRHPCFRAPTQGRMWLAHSLSRVLCAYAAHNPHIGYCQGMNFLAAFILLVFASQHALTPTDNECESESACEPVCESERDDFNTTYTHKPREYSLLHTFPVPPQCGASSLDATTQETSSSPTTDDTPHSSTNTHSYKELSWAEEERVFFLFLTLLDQFLPSQYFSPTMSDAHIDQGVLLSLLTQHLPQLTEHIHTTQPEISLTLLTQSWFLSLFLDALSNSPAYSLCALRVWDVYFCEGHTTLFALALGLFKLHEKTLLGLQGSEVFAFVKEMGSHVFGVDEWWMWAFGDCDCDYVKEREALTQTPTQIQTHTEPESTESVERLVKERCVDSFSDSEDDADDDTESEKAAEECEEHEEEESVWKSVCDDVFEDVSLDTSEPHSTPTPRTLSKRFSLIFTGRTSLLSNTDTHTSTITETLTDSSLSESHTVSVISDNTTPSHNTDSSNTRRESVFSRGGRFFSAARERARKAIPLSLTALTHAQTPAQTCPHTHKGFLISADELWRLRAETGVDVMERVQEVQRRRREREKDRERMREREKEREKEKMGEIAATSST